MTRALPKKVRSKLLSLINDFVVEIDDCDSHCDVDHAVTQIIRDIHSIYMKEDLLKQREVITKEVHKDLVITQEMIDHYNKMIKDGDILA